MSAHVVSGQSKDTRRVLQLGHEPSQDALDMMKELAEDRVRRFGSDITIKSSGLDEECERELENERELEREAERQGRSFRMRSATSEFVRPAMVAPGSNISVYSALRTCLTASLST